MPAAGASSAAVGSSIQSGGAAALCAIGTCRKTQERAVERSTELVRGCSRGGIGEV